MSLLATGAVALALAIGTAAPAQAQSGESTSLCANSWSYTRANSTASIDHTHTHNGGTSIVTAMRPAGVSTMKGFYKAQDPVRMSMSTVGSYSGGVFGCTA